MMEEHNYFNDRRVRSQAERWWDELDRAKMQATVTVYYEDDEGDYDNQMVEETRMVPVTFEVCPTCYGRGTHVNPSIDASGLDPHDPDLDEEFWADYRSGAYNMPCYHCEGASTIPVCADPATLALIAAKVENERQYQAEVMAERMMGA